MNWAHFKDPLYYLCLVGFLVESLTHEMTGADNLCSS